MNTTFSLVYFECCKKASNLINLTNGPFLFESEDSAKEKLLSHIRNRFAEAYADILSEGAEDYGVDIFNYTNDDDEPMTTDEAYEMLLEEKEKLTFDVLVDWFGGIANDEDMYFGYKIEELPTSTFIEELNKADAIEIDGNFIRHFNLTPNEELEDEESILLEASLVDDDMDKYEYYISVNEAEEATYNFQQKCWKVGEFDICLIKFA